MISAKKILFFGISIGLLSLIILTILSLNESLEQNIFKSILIGDLLAYFNFLMGLGFLLWGINRSNKKFLISLYSGLLLRLSLLLILLIAVLVFLEINEITFIFSILFFYFFYIIIEIIYLNLRES
jgi:Ca2+/H+ antiporter